MAAGKQIGNAVPPALGSILIAHLVPLLDRHKEETEKAEAA